MHIAHIDDKGNLLWTSGIVICLIIQLHLFWITLYNSVMYCLDGTILTHPTMLTLTNSTTANTKVSSCLFFFRCVWMSSLNATVWLFFQSWKTNKKPKATETASALVLLGVSATCSGKESNSEMNFSCFAWYKGFGKDHIKKWKIIGFKFNNGYISVP